MSTQAMAALARANAIRSARSKILQPLRRGEMTIGDVDFEAPELQSMRVIDLLASLRYRQTASRVVHKPPATYKAQTILNRLQINGNRRLRDLTARQKRSLVGYIQATIPAQRRSR